MNSSNPSFDLSAARAGESSFFAGVYRWMGFGLVLTAATAFVVHDVFPQFIMALVTNRPLFWGYMIAHFVLGMVLSAGLMRMPIAAATALFALYSAMWGVFFSLLLVLFTGASLTVTASVTAGTFIIFSVYGHVTKQDLSKLGSLCVMALFGIILASLVNIFLKSSALEWVMTFVGIAVFIGLIAYETQALKALYQSGMAEGEDGKKLALRGAFALYLSFINLFLLLLRIFGRQRN